MNTLSDLQKEIGDWNEATFSGQTVRGKIHHLIRESIELLEEPADRVEQADVLILLLEVVRMTGGTAEDLVAAAYGKMEINKKRVWPDKPDELGVFRHIKEEQVSGSRIKVGSAVLSAPHPGDATNERKAP